MSQNISNLYSSTNRLQALIHSGPPFSSSSVSIRITEVEVAVVAVVALAPGLGSGVPPK